MITREVLAGLPTAQVLSDGPATHNRAVTNSKDIEPGDLFVALIGVRDGHDFVPMAIDAGATAVVVDRPVEAPDGVAVVQVADTLRALRDLGSGVRAASKSDVIAVTGSVGKTTFKDLLAHVLDAVPLRSAEGASRRVLATPKSYNNHLGVPMTLTMLEPDTTDFVAEVGTNHPGEIGDLIGLIKPRAALVTNIGHAHLGNFGSPEALANEKASIYSGVDADGVWFVNADDPLLRAAIDRLDKPAGTRLITYGLSGEAEVRVDDVAVSDVATTGRFGAVEWSIPLIGAHFGNTVAAIFAVTGERGLDPVDVARALTTFPGSPGRASISLLRNGNLRLIDDTYNGSPDSMLAGLTTLRGMPESRRIAVLGEMVELGEWSEEMHQKVGTRVGECATDLVFVGPSFEIVREAAIAAGLPADRAHVAESATDAGALLKALLDDRPTAVFVKGSRFTHMERAILSLEGMEVTCTLQKCTLYIHCRTCPQLQA